MANVRVASLTSEFLEAFGDAMVNGLHFSADPANKMMMVMRAAVIELITQDTVTEITASYDTHFLHCRQTTIDRHQIASASLETPMDLFRSERPVFFHKHRDYFTPGSGNSQLTAPQTSNCIGKKRLTIRGIPGRHRS